MKASILHIFSYLIILLLLLTQCKDTPKLRVPLLSMPLIVGEDYPSIEIDEWKIQPHEFYWDSLYWDNDLHFYGLKLDIENIITHDSIELEFDTNWVRQADGKWENVERDIVHSNREICIR